MAEVRPARLSFRSRLTAALFVTALLPLATFAALVAIIDAVVPGSTGGEMPEILLFVGLVVAVLTIPMALLFGSELLRPLREVARSVDRVSAGDLEAPLTVSGDDELARLAESHNRLAADLQRRSAQVGRILDAMGGLSPRDGAQALALRAGADAAHAFDLIDATAFRGPPSAVPETEIIPGETRSLRAVLRIADEELGVLLGWLPATRAWSRPDQDLFELFASQVAVALRNAELFARVESQNAKLRELDAAKDEFLRGVSHNLQSPLTSIRAYADQIARERPDGRLEIIAEQSERLSRMVRQLLTVSRLESGAIRPRSEVINLGTRARKAWEALAAGTVPFNLDDRADGWLAIADSDQLDQVLWALLDNAVKHGEGKPVSVTVAPDAGASRLRLTVADAGPGISDEDRRRLFGRFERGSQQSGAAGSGLGLYVSRELCRAMGGDLALEPAAEGGGAAFSIYLPAERADEI